MKNPTDPPGAAAYPVNVSAQNLAGEAGITLDVEAVPAQ